MHLAIVGTGKMGKVLQSCAAEDADVTKISVIEPLCEDSWPADMPDLIIDFSHPAAIYQIYAHCEMWSEERGDPRRSVVPAVVLATTGYGADEERVIEELSGLCAMVRKTNFSRGVDGFIKIVDAAKDAFGQAGDVRISETHHILKKDAPSGTAKTICDHLGIGEEEYDEKVTSIRMGTVFGEHSVFFALEDEVVEIRHTAYSKRIFALGALAAGKSLLKR